MEGNGREKASGGATREAAEIDVLRQRIEALEREKKDLEAFNYSAAHDLYAPLTRIEGYSEILLHEYSRNHQPDEIIYMQRVNNAAKQAKRLITDLLDLSRSSHPPSARQPVDLSDLCAGILREFSRHAPDRKAKFVVHPGMTVMASGVLTRILMMNLLENAWKYTRKNEISNIEVGMKEEDGVVIYYVADDGIGFEQDKADEIFAAFRRLSSDPAFEGSGVGLATAKRIVQHHGGRIWARSRPGLGAVFYFTMPGP